jgi:DNA transposition AAA+ family ATPase
MNTNPNNSTPTSEDQIVPLVQQNNGNTARASWNFSLDAVRANLAHCMAERKEAMISAFLWCIDPAHPVTIDEFAKASNQPKSTILKVFAGHYRHPVTKVRLEIPEDMAAGARNFLKLERERMSGGKNEFILIPTAKRICTIMDLARESQTPAFISGGSQIGKSWASIYYAGENNHGATPYMRMKAASGLGGMVRRFSQVVGNTDNCNTLDGVERIKRALTPNSLPIFDEAHLLQYTYRKGSFFACMEVLREILDEVGCGGVFVATHLLLDAMYAARNREMQQLLRRGVHRLDLGDMPTRGDLTAIFNHNALDFPDDKETVAAKIGKETFFDKLRPVIRQLAKVGGLKAITERVRYGRKLATKENSVITWSHFYIAHLLIERQAQPEPDWD